MKYKLTMMRHVSTWTRFVCWAAIAAGGAAGVAAQNPAQEHPGAYSQADIAAGARLYTGQCANCHGATGESVGNVDLRRGRFRNASSDDDLKKVIRSGIRGTAMPASNLSDAELTALVAYIRAGFDLNAPAVKVGDRARGRTIFEGKGACGSCHRVGGRGPYVAPDLSDIGAERSPAALQLSMLDPTGHMQPINRPIRIVMRDGRTIRGRRLNEDTYTVQLIDDQERLLSLSKADMKEYEVITTSPMPSYKGKLSTEEIADVVAYLLSLRG